MNLSETKVGKGVCTFGPTVLFGVLLCLAVDARAALSEFGAEFYRGDGSLADPAKNSRGEMLTEQHYIYFQHSADGQPGQTSRVTVPDGFKLDNINLANVWTTWSGVAGLDDSCAVTLVGSPLQALVAGLEVSDDRGRAHPHAGRRPDRADEHAGLCAVVGRFET